MTLLITRMKVYQDELAAIRRSISSRPSSGKKAELKRLECKAEACYNAIASLERRYPGTLGAYYEQCQQKTAQAGRKE